MNTVVERFISSVVESSSYLSRPVFCCPEDPSHRYMYIQKGGVYFLAVTAQNSEPVTVLTFLYKLAECLKAFVGVRMTE
jgi:hypothetical protein